MKNKLLHYLNESPTVFFILEKHNNSWDLEYVTSNVINLYGHCAEDFLSKKYKHEDFIFAEDLHQYRTEVRQILKFIKDEYTFKPYRLLNNNEIIWVNHIIKIVRDKDGKISHYYGYLTDITLTQNTKKELDQYFNIIDENVLISVTDEKGIIISASNAYCKLTKYTKDELIGKNHNIFRHPSTKDIFFEELWGTIKKGDIWKGEHLNLKKDGTEFWVENSITPNFDDKKEIIGYTSVYNDITDKKRIIELSITDYLTQLYNRRHFSTIFDRELNRAKRDNKNFILMMVDIDFFKQYNDTYGHNRGDEVLKSIANALKESLKRPVDFIFRLGGEEFGIITSDIDFEGALELSNQLLQAVRDLGIEHKSSKISDIVTISMGIKIVNLEAKLDETTIYKLADNALYEAKEKGRDKVIIH
jgi:diguanylate cyclase (GGDEF)-like protein/PAS domain S-box-containing protein